MIRAIFFSRFHPEKGPVVLHQVPEGSIVPSPTATIHAPLFDFDSISDYIIPRQEFCGELVTICTNHYRIIGFPICVVDPSKYDRNEYIFNFSLVLDENVDMSGYQDVVRMLASLFMDLEIQESLLSSEGLRYTDGNVASEHGLVGSKVHAICEMVLEDLNNYCEFMMPIDDRNTLNMKLFPTYTSPTDVKPWHIPLSTARLQSLIDPSWDLTMFRIAHAINGVNSVAVISRITDTNINLTRQAITHLSYYGCLLLLDIFQYSAVYAPTADIATIFTDLALQDECVQYISTTANRIDRNTILQLYASMRHGLALKAWCSENMQFLHGIDIRRFVTFGVIKGFLYRVHKFAVAAAPATVDHITRARLGFAERALSGRRDSTVSIAGNLRLAPLLNGLHCFDDICTSLGIGEKTLERAVKTHSDVQIIHK